MVIRENKMFEIVGGIIETALNLFGIRGYTVIQHDQPTDANKKPSVMMSRVSGHRHGWQREAFETKDTPEGKVRMVWNYIEEVTFQISAYSPRSADEPENVVTPLDVLGVLQTFFNSNAGIRMMLDHGMHPFRVIEIRQGVQQNDTDQQQFNPNFDLKFCVEQSMDFDAPEIGEVNVKMS